VYIFPPAEGINSQNTINENPKIGLTEKEVVKVNAATKKTKATKYKKTYKKVKATKYKKTYKKVKAAKYTRTSSTYSSSEWVSDATMDNIIRSGARFRYSRGTYHTDAQMEKYGYGDCWAMADYLVKKLNAAGYTAKVAPAPGTGNHRHAFVLINGRWVKVPYGKYGISRSFG